MTSGIRGLLIDLDGTVYTEDGLVPGAREALRAVRTGGLRLRFVTNTSRKPRSAVLERLRELEIEAEQSDVITAPVAALAWLRERGAERVGLLVSRSTWEDFGGLEVVGPEDGEPGAVDHLVIGDLGSAWDFETLNWGFRRLLGGAALVAIQKNRYWDAGDGLALDAGPFVAALEFATGREATVVGKPSRAFFEAAASSMGLAPGDCAMVGDDLESDVVGAQEAGVTGILVRTGKFRRDDLGEDEVRRRADAVLDSLAELPGWLGI
jgi:HAD superfamily hydrolase (TIGR01458 family)